MRLHLQAAVAAALALAAAACAAVQAASPGTPGVIVGTLRDAATGRPLTTGSACVWLTASPSDPPMRCALADSTGTFRVDSLQPGQYTLRLQCASMTILPSILDTATVEITGATPVRRDVSVSTATCDKRSRREITGTFRGHYSAGFEESIFTPCPSDRWFIPSDSVGTRFVREGRAWVNWRKPDETRSVAWPQVERSQYGSSRYYVRWNATVTGPGHYGHFGISPFLMQVDSILEVRAPGANDCG
jgi:hypothetical protein